jgi:hypothetical protein
MTSMHSSFTGNTYEVPNTITIIDDDDDDRESLMEDLREASIEAVPIIGNFGNDIDRLVSLVLEKSSPFVICDYRLQSTNFASFHGTSVIKRLRAKSVPAMLLTMYQSNNRLDLRASRADLPIVISRDEFRLENIGRYATVCRLEIEGNPVDERKPHRVLISVLDVASNGGSRTIDVVVPSWRPDHALILPESCLNDSLRSTVRPGQYILGDVNIDAKNEDELFFRNLDEVVAAPNVGR